ncbi:hypothetical protein L1987_25321 [Smallanthus sonchifolius]|uniref:Uncharacterized protein n=1 Tax=Smallanthus sonchifolius TaxID=185202 RepID=A0ACB9IM55_9ASTR|nr:hypothetical protein L1987_25321 [Smallanthus sonchifolius]
MAHFVRVNQRPHFYGGDRGVDGLCRVFEGLSVRTDKINTILLEPSPTLKSCGPRSHVIRMAAKITRVMDIDVEAIRIEAMKVVIMVEGHEEAMKVVIMVEGHEEAMKVVSMVESHEAKTTNGEENNDKEVSGINRVLVMEGIEISTTFIMDKNLKPTQNGGKIYES